jgi:hypothetical protein
MGGFWSCCRRDKSPERTPLLAEWQPTTEEPPHSAFEKLADIIGAVNSGRIPSQEQVSALLQHALRSEFLRDPGHTLPTYGGPLSQRGIDLMFEIRELVDAVLRIGLEKNCMSLILILKFSLTILQTTTRYRIYCIKPRGAAIT